MTRQKKQRFIPFIVAFATILVTGCGSTSLAPSDGPIVLSEEERTFNILHNWDKVGMKNHLNAGTNVGPLAWFSVESLIQYVRSTDEVYYILAENIEHHANSTSTVTLRANATWHDGTDYVADDMIGYYIVNQGQVTNYMTSLEKVDDKTVLIHWKPQMEPNERVKTLLLAVDRAGAVQYDEFKTFVDEANRILTSSPQAPAGYTGWAPFGRIASQTNINDYMANYTAFKNYNPEWFVGTGPFKLSRKTETEMLLVKNEDYWATDSIKFDFIRATNSMNDLNQKYNMLSSGAIDYQDGLAPEATMNQILLNNPNMAHYKMFDPGSIGVVFNLAKKMQVNGVAQPIWTDKAREAFQYIFDREEVKNAGNPYAITSWKPLMTMAPSEAQKYMSPDKYAEIETFSHNEQTAANLLVEAGWNKVDGWWYNGGTKVKLNVHYDGSHPGMSGVAVAVQAALTSFGVEAILKKGADFNSWFGTASSDAWAHELSVCWTDLNMSFSFPTGSFIYAYKDITAKVLHLPKYTADDPETTVIETNEFDLDLEKADGSGTFRVIDVLDGMYYLNDEELTEVVNDLVLGVSKKNFGVQFYQNVTGSFINIGKLGGVPLQDYLATSRNITYVPNFEDDPDNFYAVARLNFHFAYAVPFISGDLYPARLDD
jgi:peptide/nickel transport system substrate-binding protein